MLKNKSGQIMVIDEMSSTHVQGKIYKNKTAYDASKTYDLFSMKSNVIHVANKLGDRLKTAFANEGETLFAAQIRVAEELVVELVTDKDFQFPTNELLTDQEWSIV